MPRIGEQEVGGGASPPPHTHHRGPALQLLPDPVPRLLGPLDGQQWWGSGRTVCSGEVLGSSAQGPRLQGWGSASGSKVHQLVFVLKGVSCPGQSWRKCPVA